MRAQPLPFLLETGVDHVRPEAAASGTCEPAASDETPRVPTGLPDRLVTTTEIAAFVGCHEESVRRAYLCGQLKSQRFGVRSWRFRPADVRDWIARGAPTRMS